jgi:hypothetical protein
MPTENLIVENTELPNTNLLSEESKEIVDKNKIAAEIKKLEAEAERIKYDLEKQKKEDSKKWLFKEKSWPVFVSIFFGAPILGFYVTYVILPAANVENVKLNLQNQKAELRIFESQKKLTEDSILLQLNQHITDSLNKALSIALLEKQKLDSSYAVLIKQSQTLSQKNESPLKDSIKRTIQSIKGLDSAFKEALRKNDFEMAQRKKQEMLDRLASVTIAQKIKIRLVGNAVFLQQPFNLMVYKLNIKNDMSDYGTFSLSGSEDMVDLPPGRYLIKASNNNYNSTPLRVEVPFDSQKQIVVEIPIYPAESTQ